MTCHNAEESAARRIVDLLGCHPLAVEVAGSYLAQGVEGFESYLDALVNPLEDAVEFGALLKESLPTGHERSISATLLKSIQQLGSEGLDFLWLASVLAVAPIQVSFISEVFDFLDGGGLGDQGKLRALKAVDQAVALSLCERSGDDARAVHTLVSRTMFFEFPADKRTHDQRSAAVQVLTRRLERVGDIREHAKIAMDVAHARHLVTNDLQTKEEATLALLVARRDYARGEYGSARKLQEQVLEARRRVLGEDHPDTLMAVNDLAAILHAQGEAAGARKLQELVLAESRRVLGEEHPETLRAKNNFAQTLYAQRDLGGARGLQEQVLEASRRVLGEGHPNTLIAMNNLAKMTKLMRTQ